jgi:beta-lactamase class A
MKAIAEKKAVSPAASEAMLKILEAQEHNEGIPAGIPSTARVAHKTGSITRIYHDAAVVYPEGGNPYVLVVMTRGIPKEAAPERIVAAVSRTVWQARNGL